jgi:nucleoside-diphosphate-sugar epimerase
VRIVLFGASGFIGHALCRAAVRAGHDVTGVVRSLAGAERVRSVGAKPLLGSLERVETWSDAVVQSDAVIQLAADFANSPAAAEAPWAAAMLALQAAAKAPARILYTGGCWLYPERTEPPIDDTTPYDPLPAFGYMVEHRQRLMAAGLSVVTIHPGIVWSETDGFMAAYRAAIRAGEPIKVVGSVETKWPLVHVEDLVDLYLRALTGSRAGAEFLGVADPSVSVSAMIRRAEELSDARAMIEVLQIDSAVREHGTWIAGQARSQAIFTRAARDTLGWRPGRLFGAA